MENPLSLKIIINSDESNVLNTKIINARVRELSLCKKRRTPWHISLSISALL